MSRALILAALLAPALASAQSATPSPPPAPAPTPAPAPPAAAPPLAAIRSDKELAAALASITQDPTIPVNDPKVRAIAQALMIEGVKRLNAKSYDQALANFLDAYGMLPSPRILLDIGSTLRDMGRAADAANTYQRYILDPGTGAERVGEVKQLLIDLDATLTILTVHVFPRGSDISIDGGPFIPVGSTLVTRVRAGIHLVRMRHGNASAELTVNGFAGEDKELAATLPADAAEPIAVEPTPPATKPTTTPTTTTTTPTTITPPPATMPPKPAEPPDRVDAWLSTGTGYTSGDPGGNDRRVRDGFQGEEILPIIPQFDEVGGTVVLREPEPEIGSGLLAMTRIDGRGRGVAAGFGVALSGTNHIEIEAAVLRSQEWGAYVGVRYRLMTGAIRPYVGAGMPIFEFDDDRAAGDPTKVSYGARGAAGVEIDDQRRLQRAR